MKKRCGKGKRLLDSFSVSPTLTLDLCRLTHVSGRIGVKALQSNALLAAQKKNGSATINEKSLKHFSDPVKVPGGRSERRSASPSKGSNSSGGKGKGKVSAKNSDDEGEEDSGDEAEKLDDEQMNELDNIYRKYAASIL